MIKNFFRLFMVWLSISFLKCLPMEQDPNKASWQLTRFIHIFGKTMQEGHPDLELTIQNNEVRQPSTTKVAEQEQLEVVSVSESQHVFNEEEEKNLLHQKLKKQKEKKRAYQRYHQVLSWEVEDLIDENNKLKEKVDTHEQCLEEASIVHANLEKGFTSVRKVLQQISQLREEGIDFIGYATSLQCQIDQMRQENNALQDEKTQALQRIADLQSQLKITNEKLNDVQQEHDTLNKKLNEIYLGPDPRDHPFHVLVTQERFNDITAQVYIKPQSVKEEITLEEKEKIQTNYTDYYFVRRKIRPQLMQENSGKILLVTVHGTASNADSFGEQMSKRTTMALLHFAASLSYAYKSKVELLPFKWPGKFKQKVREDASTILHQKLTKELEKEGKDKVTQVWAIAHSEGINVLNKAAEYFSNVRVFDVGIFIAGTENDLKLEEMTHGVFNFKHAYQFYGLNDQTAGMAAIVKNWSFKKIFPSYCTWIMHNNGQELRKLTNIRLLKEGKELNHINIKLFTIMHLPELLYTIDSIYSKYTDLEANVFEDIKTEPLICISKIDQSNNPDAHTIAKYDIERACTYSAEKNIRFKELYGRDMCERHEGYDKIQWTLVNKWCAIKDELYSALDNTL